MADMFKSMAKDGGKGMAQMAAMMGGGGGGGMAAWAAARHDRLKAMGGGEMPDARPTS